MEDCWVVNCTVVCNFGWEDGLKVQFENLNGFLYVTLKLFIKLYKSFNVSKEVFLPKTICIFVVKVC